MRLPYSLSLAAWLLSLLLYLPSSGHATELPEVLGKLQSYTADSRTSLYSIGRKFSVGIYHLRQANRLRRNIVQKGNSLVIPTIHIPPLAKHDGLVLNLPERMIYFYRNGQALFFYPVAVGRPSMPTPAGNFRVISKVKHPTWMPPVWAGVDHPVPPGPNNPLGDRWIGLSAPGIGIHSTNAPASVGWTASHGCIRMFPWNVHKLFQKVRVGDPVIILNEPVKLGVRDGVIYLEVHPQLYRRKSYEKLLREKAKAIGIEELIDWQKAKRIIAEKRAYAVPFIGERVTVQNVDGKTQVGALIRKGGTFYASLPFFFWATGAEGFEFSEKSLMIVGEGGTAELVKESGTILINGGVTTIPFSSAGNHFFVPLRLLSDALGVQIVYRPQEKKLYFSRLTLPPPSI